MCVYQVRVGGSMCQQCGCVGSDCAYRGISVVVAVFISKWKETSEE